jgi:hypothetical protein
MTTQELGKQLVEMCNAGKNEQALESLYARDVVSLEAGAPPGQSAEAKGLDAVLAKTRWWNDNHTVHASTCEGPYPNGDRFAVKFTFDITHKPSNRRFTMQEIGLYTVKDDKIVREEFFYAM